MDRWLGKAWGRPAANGEGRGPSVVAEISVSTRCNQRTTPIAAILAPFRPLRQLHPRVTHWRGTLNSVSLPWIVAPAPPASCPLFAPLLPVPLGFIRSLDSILSSARGRHQAAHHTRPKRLRRQTIRRPSPFSAPFLPEPLFGTVTNQKFTSRRGNEDD